MEGTPTPTISSAPHIVGHYKVATTDAGLKTKLGMMASFVEAGKRDPRLYAWVRQLLHANNVAGKDQKGEIECIVSFCEHNIDYRRDTNGIEVFSAPFDTLSWGGGDCDDFAICICTLLELVGFKTKFKVIQTKNANSWNHVYATVEYPRGSGRYIAIDSTMPQYQIGWEAPKSMVTRSLEYGIGTPLPPRTETMASGINSYYDWTGANMAQEVEGLGAWYNNWNDFTHAISVNVGSLVSYGTSAGQTIYSGYQQVARETQQVYANMSQYITNGVHDLTKLQLPAFMRNSPLGTYLTQKIREAERSLAHLLPNSPLKKAVAWMLIGNLPGAIAVIKAHQEEVIRDLPPYARNIINKMRTNLPQYLGGTRNSLSGLDSSFTWWDHLSNGKKTAIIAIIVVAIVLYVLCAIYAGCSLSVAIAKLAEMSVVALTGAVGAVSSFIAMIISTVKSWFISDPNVPPTTSSAVTNPPSTQYQPTQEDLNAMVNAGKSGQGLGVAGAVLVGLLVLV